MVIRTKVSAMRTIGRNTLGVRLIKLDDGDTVSSLAKLPEDELDDAAELDTINPDSQSVDLNGATDGGPGSEPPLPFDEPHPPHIIDDGVAEAEASDHLDLDDETDDQLGLDNGPSDRV
jgi:DNA gyrase subunit A